MNAFIEFIQPALIWVQHNALALFLLIAGLASGYVIAHLRQNNKIADWRERAVKAAAERDTERNAATQRETLLINQREQMRENFTDLANQALKSSNEELLKLAREQFANHQSQAKADLGARHNAIENLIKPLGTALEKTEAQIQQLEKDRKQAYGSLSSYLDTLQQSQQQLKAETHNLVTALRSPTVRGQWGEMTLRRLVELAGMKQHCDFDEQATLHSDTGRQRPDLIIKLPGNGAIIVDAKTPLDRYLTAVENTDPAARKLELAQHARNVRERVKELAQKSYWAALDNSPEFAVLFIPGEHFLAAALDHDPALYEDALIQKIIIATPASLLALLKTIAFGWRQEALSENAEEIRKLAEQLLTRFGVFAEHLAKTGKALGNSVDAYNKTVGSMERNLLTSTRKLAELGVNDSKETAAIEPLEKTPREVTTTAS